MRLYYEALILVCEQYRDSTQLLYLRARYYNPADGRFQSRDTWGGDANRPMSMNRWNYVESNPVNLTDPTGMFPEWCKSMGTRLQYEDCVRRVYNLRAPKDYSVMPPNPEKNGPYGSSGCWSGPVAYKAPGYLEGYSKGWIFGIGVSDGEELVYDFATMEKEKFSYKTVSLALEAGVSTMAYHGLVFGFNNVDGIEKGYRGAFAFGSVGASTDIIPSPYFGTGVNGFKSTSGEVWGISQYYSVGFGYNGLSTLLGGFPLSLSGGWGNSTPAWSKPKSYVKFGGVNKWELIGDIALDPDSPVWAGAFLPSALVKYDGFLLADHYSWIYNEINLESR